MDSVDPLIEDGNTVDDDESYDGYTVDESYAVEGTVVDPVFDV